MKNGLLYGAAQQLVFNDDGIFTDDGGQYCVPVLCPSIVHLRYPSLS